MTASFNPSDYLSPGFNDRTINKLKAADLQHPEVLEGVAGYQDRAAVGLFMRLFRADLDEIPSPDRLSEDEDKFFPSSKEMFEALASMCEGMEKLQVDKFEEFVLEVLPLMSYQLRGKVILFLFHQWMMAQKKLAERTAKDIELMIARAENPDSVIMFLKKEGS